VVKYAYNSDGGLGGITGPGWSMRFGYDAAGRLASETRSGTGGYLASYGYDRNGNRTRMPRYALSSVVNVIDFNNETPPIELVLPAAAGQWEVEDASPWAPEFEGRLKGSGTGEARVGLTLGPDDARCYEVTILPEPYGGAAGISLICNEGRLLVGAEVVAGTPGPDRRLVAILVDHEGNAQEVAASVPMAYAGGDVTLRVAALAGETDLVMAALSEGEGLAQDVSLACAGAASGDISLEVRASDGVSSVMARFDNFAWMATTELTDSLAYSHDSMNRLTAITGQKAGEPYEESFGYDQNGLLLLRSLTEFDAGGAPVGFSPTNFSYDRLNRLTTVSTPTGLSTYAYAGPSWMRTSATVTSGGAPVTTSYVYDGFACLRQSTGGVSTHYAAPGGMPLWETTGTATTSYGTDWFGSVTARVGSGGVNSSQTFDAYGNPTVTQPGAPNPHASTVGYRGQLVDHATGQVFLRNRFYSPDLGRFMAPDPIGHDGGLNLYVYAGCDPVNRWDPMGLDWVYAGGGKWVEEEPKGVPYPPETDVEPPIGFRWTWSHAKHTWNPILEEYATPDFNRQFYECDALVRSMFGFAATPEGLRSWLVNTQVHGFYKPDDLLGFVQGFSEGATVIVNEATLGQTALAPVAGQISARANRSVDPAASTGLGMGRFGVHSLFAAGGMKFIPLPAPTDPGVRAICVWGGAATSATGTVAFSYKAVEAYGEGRYDEAVTYAGDAALLGVGLLESLRVAWPRRPSMPRGMRTGKPMYWDSDEAFAAALVEAQAGEIAQLQLGPHRIVKGHHLNQVAAYGGRSSGVSIGMMRGGIVGPGANPMHVRAHQYTEGWWTHYRAGGVMEMVTPTNTQYTLAEMRALRYAGLSEAQVRAAIRAAIRDRIAAGALGGQPVANVPNVIRAIRPLRLPLE